MAAPTISFHGLNYFIEIKEKLCGKKQKKQILKENYGIFKPGMNAILGPTGSGKTTLMDILAGRKEREGLTGEVLVDGKKQPKDFKIKTGYVVQDDIVMGTLTVRENLMFSANMRLPFSMDPLEKKEKVEKVIKELGLEKCSDTKVGTEFIRGVSGGERKRVNIGMELIISPSILFLDEPTTGLDSFTAISVMKLLQSLSENGRNIIFSIHQPRYSIFKLFNSLFLLDGGETVYHGNAQNALIYFDKIGYQCENHNNPPDFFLDVIHSQSTLHNNKSFNNYGVSLEMENLPVEKDGKNNMEEKNEKLTFKFKNSDEYKKIYIELKEIEKSREKDQGTLRDSGYATPFYSQIRFLAERTLRNLVRNPQTLLMQSMVTLFFSFTVGIIYFQLGYSFESAIQNRVGAFFFIVMNQIFSNISSVELFIRERNIFRHESASGYYRVSSYFFSKIICDVIPMRFLPVTIFSLIAYFMIGFQVDPGKFFFFYLCIFLTTFSASALGILISSSVSIFAIANLLIALCYVVMMLFGGVLVNLKTMAGWISWLQYLSLVRYSLNALGINELKDLKLIQEINNTIIMREDIGINFLNAQGIKHESLWHLWQNPLALLLIGLLFLIFSYIQLRRMPKIK